MLCSPVTEGALGCKSHAYLHIKITEIQDPANGQAE